MAKKATKKTTKKVAKKATKKVAKKTTKKVAKKATKKVAKKATKKVAKKATKKVAKTATKKVAKTATKKVAKKASQKVAKPAAVPALELPAIGSEAPMFTLENQDGNLVSLESFKGLNVLVYFYPRAMTPGCTVQACGLRDSYAALEESGVVVLGISPDKPSSLKKFEARDNLNFPLLSDPDNKVAKAYGSFGQKQFMGRTFDGILRQSFLIGKDGRILHVIRNVNTKTHAQDVLDLFSNQS